MFPTQVRRSKEKALLQDKRKKKSSSAGLAGVVGNDARFVRVYISCTSTAQVLSSKDVRPIIILVPNEFGMLSSRSLTTRCL